MVDSSTTQIMMIIVAAGPWLGVIAFGILGQLSMVSFYCV